MADERDGGRDRDTPAGRGPTRTDPDEDVLGALRDGPTRFLPPQTEAVRRELREGDRQLLHCLDCGRQVVARRHGGSCLLCGSAAVVVESV